MDKSCRILGVIEWLILAALNATNVEERTQSRQWGPKAFGIGGQGKLAGPWGNNISVPIAGDPQGR